MLTDVSLSLCCQVSVHHCFFRWLTLALAHFVKGRKLTYLVVWLPDCASVSENSLWTPDSVILEYQFERRDMKCHEKKHLVTVPTWWLRVRVWWWFLSWICWTESKAVLWKYALEWENNSQVPNHYWDIKV